MRLQEAPLVRPVRRLGGKHCEEVRVRQMRRRQRVWLRVPLWCRQVDRWRRQLMLLVGRPVPLVLRLRRQLRSRVRWPGQRC